MLIINLIVAAIKVLSPAPTIRQWRTDADESILEGQG